MFFQNQFDISLWLISSILLFVFILASIPIIKTLLALVFILASSLFKKRQVTLYKFGVKLLPAFLRATLGIGLAVSFTQPAHASTEPVIIDRIINFETPSSESTLSTYIVKRGDSLWKIAEAHMVTMNPSVHDIDSAWRKLWEHNRDVIGENPSMIYAGQKLVLP